MDPRTGYPAQGMLSVSVIAPRTLDSEVWAKPYFVNGRHGRRNISQRTFACSFAKTGRNSHARGSNDKPFSRCLPAPADRCAAGLVHAAGRPVYEAVPGDPREARHSGNLQAARSGGHVTLQPVEILDVDAAIIFADLLLPVEPMGLKLRYAAGEGPGHRQSGAHSRRCRFALHHQYRRSGLRGRGHSARWCGRWPAGCR